MNDHPTTTKEVSVLDPALKGINPSRAEQIEAVFVPMVQTLKEFEAEHASILEDAAQEITEDVVERAGTLRKAIAHVRITTEKTRKAEKEEYLRAGKAIDGVANILKFAVQEKEDQLKEIENHFENMEQERLNQLRTERMEQIMPYRPDDATLGVDYAAMDEDVWKHYLHGVIKAHDDKIEAEKKAEADRIAAEKKAAEEQEAQRLENIKLKAEAEVKEQELKKQQEQQAKIAAEAQKKLEAVEAAAKKEREALEVKAENERKAAEEKQLALQAEMNKIAAEQKKKDDHEKALAKAQADHEKALAKAGDAEQLLAFKEDVLKLYKAVPTLKDKAKRTEILNAIKTVGELCK